MLKMTEILRYFFMYWQVERFIHRYKTEFVSNISPNKAFSLSIRATTILITETLIDAGIVAENAAKIVCKTKIQQEIHYCLKISSTQAPFTFKLFMQIYFGNTFISDSKTIRTILNVLKLLWNSNYLREINGEGSISWFMFDGKTDMNEMLYGENGLCFLSTQPKEHVTFVGQPGNVYLGHVTSKTKDARTTQFGIFSWIYFG